MSDLTTLRAALAEARKTTRKAAAAIIGGRLYKISGTNVYEFGVTNTVLGAYVGRLNPDRTIDTDAAEDEEVVDLLGLDTVPISTTASSTGAPSQIHDDLVGLDFASVSTTDEEAEPVPSGVRRRYNRHLRDYLAVGQSIYFNYCGVVEYAAVWDGTYLCIKDLAVAGRNARVKAPSTFAERVLEHLIWNGVAWKRTTASANGWTECYVKVDGMPVKLRDLPVRA